MKLDADIEIKFGHILRIWKVITLNIKTIDVGVFNIQYVQTIIFKVFICMEIEKSQTLIHLLCNE